MSEPHHTANDHDTPDWTPHDPDVTASCPRCGWHADMCHCPHEGDT